MKNIPKEVKVGIVIVASALILLVLLFKMGKFDFTKKGYKVNVLFNFASGISENAPVRVLGVEVGKVEEITLRYDEETKVLLVLWLEESARIKMDAKAYISSLGLMGQKYIELNPGSAEAPLLQPGSIITGEDPFQMETFTKKGEDLIEKLGKALTDVRSLTTNVDGMVTENRDEVNKIMGNIEETTANLKELSEDIKKNPWKIITKPRDWKDRM